MQRIAAVLCMAMLPAVFHCSRTAVEAKPLVAVSIPPQKFFVHKIAGNLIDVMVMIPPGASPHVFEPKPQQMAEFNRARAYFTVGVEFEKAWQERFLRHTRQAIPVLPTDLGIAKISHGDDPSCSEHDTHAHEGTDPHIWLSPELVKRQARTITEGLSRLFPEHRTLFRRNDSLFAAEIKGLQDSIRVILSGTRKGQPFLVFHPSWGYFAREFNLRQIAIEVDGNEPSPAELKTIINEARKANIRTVFAQPQFSKRAVEVISRELGARVAFADPLAEHWDANLLSCARALAGTTP